VRPAGFEPGIAGLEGSDGRNLQLVPSPPATQILNWPLTKEGFLEYVRFKKYSVVHGKGMVSYLDRFVSEIRSPFDVMHIFADLTVGQQDQLNRGMRAWFKYLEITGQANEDFLNRLRKAIPKDETGMDVNVSSEENIISSLKRMKQVDPGYNALYNMILDSGLRLVEAVQLINNIQNIQVEARDGFFAAPLGYFRKTKLAFYGFYMQATADLITQVNETLNDRNATSYLSKGSSRNVITWKYLRKFAFDKMIELEIPESVANFIQGRTPKSVGAKHYMVLIRQAKKFYPRYAEYITGLRQKALS
jgi:intergrase/recombinase